VTVAWDLAAKIDRHALTVARKRADALAGQKAVYAALGLYPELEAAVMRRRRQVRR
jgi:xylose isomerase